ncbi:unnamed protein product [Meloidogyne enterolobii]|uniref:Uncharacterized protein n=1 Tax=Meloidogyne enterolobii TaxID=390850 RepID=A0ACB1AYM2_MELEN
MVLVIIEVIEGEVEGQTHTDLPESERAYFAHPIDVHLATRTIQGKFKLKLKKIFPFKGWPRILVEVWHYDKYGRHSISGYGNCFVPSSPGEHKVECHCWRPKGNFREELTRSFIGGGLQLRSANVLLGI